MLARIEGMSTALDYQKEWRAAALEIKTRFPALQVSIYDGSSKSRTVVGLPGSAS